MERLRDLFTKEPALIIGLVLAAIGLLTSFGLAITEEQTGAIVAFVGAVLALAGFLFARQNVYSPRTHEREVKGAYVDGMIEGQARRES